jgi:hypothetical protein
MLNIGEYVLNQKTGHFGKVIGYGHKIVNNAYMTTLKVLVNQVATSEKRGFIEEDLFTAYAMWPQS